MNASNRSYLKARRVVVGIATGVLLSAAVTTGVWAGEAGEEQPPVPVEAPAGTNTLSDVYQAASPSVVAISVRGEPSEDGIPSGGFGSGFVFDHEGHIITNDHVVAQARSIAVEFSDGTLSRAKVIGLDPDSDLAIIKVDVPSTTLVPVEFADSDKLVIGQTAVALGSPFGQEWTLTSGIVSALERAVPGMTQFSIGGVIQTDAAINPGNSGGPLLDSNGRVIGVNAQIVSMSGSNSGIGFAIPSNLVQRVARDLIDRGYVEYSYLGMSGGDITLSLIEALGLPQNQQGVVVYEVVPGGPAARADLQGTAAAPEEGQSVDIITAIDGEPLAGMSNLISYLASNTRPGDTVKLDVLRNGHEALEIDLTLIPR